MTGTAGPQGDCHNSTNNNAGCTVSGAPATYGPDFNAAGGGVVALEWRVEGIRVWVLPRGGGVTPNAATVAAEAVPDPSVWGQPLADFPATGCDVASHFRNQSIVVNIDLCGYLTEAVWASSGCRLPPLDPFCFVVGGGLVADVTRDRPFQLHGLCCEQPGGFHECVLGVWVFPRLQGVVEVAWQARETWWLVARIWSTRCNVVMPERSFRGMTLRQLFFDNSHRWLMYK